MIKQKMIIECSTKDFFNEIVLGLKEQYKSLKGEYPTQDIQEGFSFKVKLKKKDEVVGKGVYRVLKYDYPYHYCLEYTSHRFYKIVSAELEPIDETHAQLLFGEFSEKLKDGKKPKPTGEDKIINAKLMTKLSVRKMVKSAKQREKEAL